MNEVEDALAKLARTKAALEAATELHGEATAEAVEALKAAGIKSSSVYVPQVGQTFQGTLVEPTTVKIDWEGLEEDIGSQVFNEEVCEVVVQPSEKRLEAAVQNGHVDLDTVEANSTIVERKPYLKTTWKAANDKPKNLKNKIKEDITEPSPRKINAGKGAKVRRLAQQRKRAGDGG